MPVKIGTIFNCSEIRIGDDEVKEILVGEDRVFKNLNIIFDSNCVILTDSGFVPAADEQKLDTSYLNRYLRMSSSTTTTFGGSDYHGTGHGTSTAITTSDEDSSNIIKGELLFATGDPPPSPLSHNHVFPAHDHFTDSHGCNMPSYRSLTPYINCQWIHRGMVFLSEGTCPVGWTDISSSFVGKYIRLMAGSGSTGGNGIASVTHYHSLDMYTSTTMIGNVANRTYLRSLMQFDSHRHGTSHSHSKTIEFPRVTLKAFKYIGTSSIDVFPASIFPIYLFFKASPTIIPFTYTTIPTDYNKRFCCINSTVGTNGTNLTETHTHESLSVTTTGMLNLTGPHECEPGTTRAGVESHTHTASHSHPSADYSFPAWVRLYCLKITGP